jgi:pyrimidine-nucleoside phosphorylase/thymidine phosphorylase
VTIREIIAKKRDGGRLTDGEIGFFIQGYTKSEVTDYQASALLMAICIRGMDANETRALTQEMRDSGEVLDLSAIPGAKIDKHSTGGVGDKTSLLLAPIVAACGVTVPMMAGRALAHTGGTIDKLESIPGFDTSPEPRRIVSLLARNGAILMGQTRDLAPADRLLYALRDATETVISIPLITASILSKKLAEDIDGLVLDVKTGSGAVMPTPNLSMQLARSIASTCRKLKTKIVVLLTDMDQPLGCAVGNALEVRECVDFLNGTSPADLQTLTLALASHMILMAGKARTMRAAERMALDTIESGAARQRFFDIVKAQGGDTRALENLDLLPKARNITALKAVRTGIVNRADARLIGDACNALGAGRVKMDDTIDPAVGVVLRKKVGDRAIRGETLCDIHWNDEQRLHSAMPLLKAAFKIGNHAVRRRPLILDVLR